MDQELSRESYGRSPS